MDRTSPLPSDEAQPPNNRLSRSSVDEIEPRDHSNDNSISPLPPPTTTTHHGEYSRERTETAPAYTSMDRQPQHLGVRRENQDSPGHKDSSIHRVWLWEMLSILVASFSLLAIVITLVLRRDRPLPKWPSAITINALIAVFTAIFKACLMLPIAEGIAQLKWLWYQKSRPLRHMEQWDMASRGPWGSLLLILVLSSQNLAVLGAILTLVAMAVDPFTQQIVQFYSCSRIIKGESARLPFSNNYTIKTTASLSTPPYVDPQMQAAIYAGLLDPPENVSAVINFECKTGNCTFPSTDDGAAFLSLGLKVQCADIRSNLSIAVTTTRTSDYNQTRTISSLHNYRIRLDNTSSRWPMQSGYRGYPNWPSYFLANVSFLMAAEADKLEQTQAFECEFYPVVNTYSANVTNGVLLEQVLGSQRMGDSLLLVNRTIRAGEWHECTSSGERSDEHDIAIAEQSRTSSSRPIVVTNDTPSDEYLLNTVKWWPQDCVYWIGPEPAEGVARSLNEFLGNESLIWNGWLRVPEAKGSPWSLKLWKDGSATLETVQAAMDGLSRSITARWRQGDGQSVNLGPAIGTVWGSETCVRVNWGWIALSGGLLVLTIVFLILTIVKTKSQGTHVWKSSCFAVLFNCLDQETRQAAGTVVSLEDMKEAADKVTVRLENTKEGLRLVKHS